MKWLLTLVIFYISSSFAFAQPEFKKVGEAHMQYLLWDIYDAQLFTLSGHYKQNTHPVKFTLTYLRDIDAEDIVKATNEQWQHLGKTTLSKKYSSRLLKIWPNIKEKDTLTLVTSTQGQSFFYFNGKKIGSIEDTEFANDFLAIWLSENTSEPKLRKQLLGK